MDCTLLWPADCNLPLYRVQTSRIATFLFAPALLFFLSLSLLLPSFFFILTNFNLTYSLHLLLSFLTFMISSSSTVQLSGSLFFLVTLCHNRVPAVLDVVFSCWLYYNIQLQQRNDPSHAGGVFVTRLAARKASSVLRRRCHGRDGYFVVTSPGWFWGLPKFIYPEGFSRWVVEMKIPL